MPYYVGKNAKTGENQICWTDLEITDTHFKVSHQEIKVSDDTPKEYINPLYEHDYCHGCESGIDRSDAHTDACNEDRGVK